MPNATNRVAFCSFGKKILQRRKGLELDGVARWIEKKHGRLLARLTFEPDVRLNHKMRTCSAEFVRQCLPLRHVQHSTKVAHRDIVTINSAGVFVATFIRREVSNDLVTVEIEVNPIGRTPAFRAAQQIAIKLACNSNVVDWKCEVKRWICSSRCCHDVFGAGFKGQDQL